MERKCRINVNNRLLKISKKPRRGDVSPTHCGAVGQKIAPSLYRGEPRRRRCLETGGSQGSRVFNISTGFCIWSRMSMSRLFWFEAEFFKEFTNHIPGPLKDAHAINIQDETVFVFGVSFQFGNRTFRAKGLIVFRRKKGPGKSLLKY